MIVAGIAFVVVILGWAMLARAFAPKGNTTASRLDAIVVLGADVDRDGNPSPVLLARVTEGVREYERGVAPRLIVTGGERHGRIEAEVMARVAEAQGVPASAVVLDPNAENTIENACFSARIMKRHGWRSAEVVTSDSHLPRAEMIFSRAPIAWRGHGAPSLSVHSALASGWASSSEVMHTAYYLLYSQWAGRCSP